MNALSQSALLSPCLKWAGLAALFFSLATVIWFMLADPDGAPRRLWNDYLIHLERKLRVLFIWTPAEHIAMAQLGGILAVLCLSLALGYARWYAPIALIALGPPIAIERMRQKRVTDIEDQLDSFLLAMANALKSTPSIGDAFASVQGLIARPLQQEVELAVKEMRFGSTLPEALQVMAARIGSRRVDSALSALLIGRRVGGDLPKVLETSAATLRELARLEGVLRAKTAEGKTQLVVLALLPAVVVYGFDKLNPGYFKPLTEGFSGYAVIAVVIVLWIAAIVAARKILSVEI